MSKGLCLGPHDMTLKEELQNLDGDVFGVWVCRRKSCRWRHIGPLSVAPEAQEWGCEPCWQQGHMILVQDTALQPPCPRCGKPCRMQMLGGS